MMCQLCEHFIRKTGETFSIAFSPKDGKPIKVSETAPEDARVFTFALRSQAKEWFHRRQWERILFASSHEQRLESEEKGWIEFRSETRESIDSKKSEIERLLHSPIIKNVSQGLEMHGFKMTPSREIFRISEPSSNPPLCGSGAISEGVETATDILAMFELYLEHVHAQEIKKSPPAEEEERNESNLTTSEAYMLEEVERVIKAADELRSRALRVAEQNPQPSEQPKLA